MLDRAGLSAQADRATWSVTMEHLLAAFPEATGNFWSKPWSVEAIGNLLPTTALGQVWAPEGKVVLGREAGAWSAHVLRAAAKVLPKKWRKTGATSHLLELVLALRHKLARVKGFDSAWRERPAKDRLNGPKSQCMYFFL